MRTIQESSRQRVESSAGGPAPVAELLAVEKRYGKQTALAGVDLALRRGELTALLGPNGAGKTTAVKLLLGLARPSAGSVRLLGGDPGDAAVRARRAAMLQVAKVPETLTVREHLELFASYYPRPLPLAEALRRADLERLAERRFGDLSGGERQRTLFALAMIGDPELLLLDEPTVGFDVASRRALWAEIRRLVAEGRSVLLTTHYLEEADALADRVVVLHQGRVIADGTPSEVKRRAVARRIGCRTRLSDEALAALPGVQAVRRDEGRVEMSVDAAEPVVRELMRLDPELADLEVRTAGLEEAFLALTERATDAA
jgi:ABC-2 type transport system ATP-binding protein